jgi:hypothetical protein
VKHLQAVPAYLLIVEFSTFQWVTDQMMNAVAASLPSDVSCLVLHKGANHSAARRIKQIDGSLIFAR